MEIFQLLQHSIVFFIPAYIANAMPVIANGFKILPPLAKPISKKWFGSSKTYRGFVFGIIGAFIINLIPFFLGIYDSYESEKLTIFFWITLTLAFGALLGDLIKSFFKRRIGIKSGKSWPPFDQIDYVIGALFLSSFIHIQHTDTIITLLIISPLLSLLANIIAYKLKIKKVWW